jgi:hypothetical protein
VANHAFLQRYAVPTTKRSSIHVYVDPLLLEKRHTALANHMLIFESHMCTRREERHTEERWALGGGAALRFRSLTLATQLQTGFVKLTKIQFRRVQPSLAGVEISRMLAMSQNYALQRQHAGLAYIGSPSSKALCSSFTLQSLSRSTSSRRRGLCCQNFGYTT